MSDQQPLERVPRGGYCSVAQSPGPSHLRTKAADLPSCSSLPTLAGNSGDPSQIRTGGGGPSDGVWQRDPAHPPREAKGTQDVEIKKEGGGPAY